MVKVLKNSQVFEESTILKNEIQNKIVLQEEEKKMSEKAKKFMTESILIEKPEQIKFLMSNIQEALGQQ